MATGKLTIDLGAATRNWQALNDISSGKAGAVVKADAYGLGVAPVAQALARAGARDFFVAAAEEGVTLRAALGAGPRIFVFGGHMAGDTAIIAGSDLTPLLNAPEQIARHQSALPGQPYGVQLDTGMHRLGLQPADWVALKDGLRPTLIMSHLACADEPDHAQNAMQLRNFKAMTDGQTAPRSLAATGGTLLGPEYHFDRVRPGIGTYGAAPFEAAEAVAHLRLPVIQIRDLAPGDAVGYGATFTADTPRKIATVAAGYADGLIRAITGRATLWHGDIACPLAGRVSMDLMGVDVTDCPTPPAYLEILSARQTVDDLADAAGTIGYEILTSLGARYARTYVNP